MKGKARQAFIERLERLNPHYPWIATAIIAFVDTIRPDGHLAAMSRARRCRTSPPA